MKDSLKIAVIGAGSSYTPELMEGLIQRRDLLAIREIWFVDVEAGKEKSEITAALARRMWKKAGLEVEIHTTLDRAPALANADFVLTQFRVGQQEARIKDERVPLSYGMAGQETNGAGGIFKALRTIPVILEIVEEMKRLCPKAWLVNFTNPSGMVTEAVMRHGKWNRVVGLCNVPVIAMKQEPDIVRRKPEDLFWKFAGLNHFHWHTVHDKEGNDLTGLVLAAMADEQEAGTPSNIYQAPFEREQLLESGMVPCGYHRYYFNQEQMLDHMLEEMPTGIRAEFVKETENRLFDLYRNPDLEEKPEELSLRGGAYYSEAAADCMAAIANDSRTIMVVSTRNCGAVPGLDRDVVAEMSCLMTGCGPVPLAWDHLPLAQKTWIQAMKGMELLVVEAAVTGKVHLLEEAFALNPLIPAGPKAQRVMEELLVAHEKWLPQFRSKIQELKEKGTSVRDERVRKLVQEGK